ncbi:MAG: SRPBCC domain-containing protein [Chloroflexota bacterium]|nr:SRPBCC domain-containing protein [Chloroflexota bacterium]
MHHASAGAADAWPDQPDGLEPAARSDEVFKALADPSRRLLLDSLFAMDGQTLGQLSARLPGMTRFGVMKHLRLLEAAALVTARKIGREKLHYLNPVPVRLIHDRWTSKYAEPWVGALADLKMRLESPAADRLRHEFQVYIRTRPEDLWRAITDPEVTQRYFRGSRIEAVLRPGERIAYCSDGGLVVEGKVLEVDPPRKLVTTWSFRHTPQLRDDPASRVSWEIEPVGRDTCKLTLLHDGFPADTATFRNVRSGWPVVLSSLKSLLETGTPLTASG